MKYCVLVFCFLISSSSLFAIHFNLNYQKEQIVLKYDKDFRKNIDWDELALSDRVSMSIDKNGNIFLLDSKYSYLYKFSQEGKLLKKFGKVGQAPGELRDPGSISIFGDTIAIDEYALLKRVSLFNVNGIFKGYLKAKNNVDAITLFNNCGMIATWHYDASERLNYYLEFYDLNSKHLLRTVLYELEKNKLEFKVGKNGIFSVGPGFMGQTLYRVVKSKFLLCNTKDKEIKIYKKTGEFYNKLSIKINNKSTPEKLAENFINDTVERLKHQGFRGVGKSFINSLKKKVSEKYKYLPYFQDVIGDPEGNILVLNFRIPSNSSNKLTFQVYDIDGNYISSSSFVSDRFKNFCGYMWQNSQSLIFYNNSIFALLENTDNPDEPYYEVVKFDIPE